MYGIRDYTGSEIVLCPGEQYPWIEEPSNFTVGPKFCAHPFIAVGAPNPLHRPTLGAVVLRNRHRILYPDVMIEDGTREEGDKIWGFRWMSANFSSYTGSLTTIGLTTDKLFLCAFLT